jgi:uncharacterized membrane protein YphA (DoxX/SURF4 family)
MVGVSKSFYGRIESFFFTQDNRSEFLVFFRVAVGVVTLMHFLSTISDFDRLFSSRSIVPQDIMTAFTPDWLITFPKIVHFFEGLGIPEATTIIIVQCLFIVCCLFIITGSFSRISAFVLLILQISLTKGSSFFIYGVDFFTSMSLFYLTLFPSDNYFSLRNFLAKRPDRAANFMPVKRMFQIHISIAYFFSGFGKLLGFNWRNGEAIWKAINLPYANRDFFFNFSWLAEHPFLLIFMGWATIITEMCYPLFVWIPQTRKIWIFFTILMHLGIALTLNLYYFSAIMIVWNITNFYFEPGRVFDLAKIFRQMFFRKRYTT